MVSPVPVFVLGCVQALAVVIAHVDHDTPKPLPRGIFFELAPGEWIKRLSHFQGPFVPSECELKDLAYQSVANIRTWHSSTVLAIAKSRPLFFFGPLLLLRGFQKRGGCLGSGFLGSFVVRCLCIFRLTDCL